MFRVSGGVTRCERPHLLDDRAMKLGLRHFCFGWGVGRSVARSLSLSLSHALSLSLSLVFFLFFSVSLRLSCCFFLFFLSLSLSLSLSLFNEIGADWSSYTQPLGLPNMTMSTPHGRGRERLHRANPMPLKC